MDLLGQALGIGEGLGIPGQIAVVRLPLVVELDGVPVQTVVVEVGGVVEQFLLVDLGVELRLGIPQRLGVLLVRGV
jgi:hypothetical protein